MQQTSSVSSTLASPPSVGAFSPKSSSFVSDAVPPEKIDAFENTIQFLATLQKTVTHPNPTWSPASLASWTCRRQTAICKQKIPIITHFTISRLLLSDVTRTCSSFRSCPSSSSASSLRGSRRSCLHRSRCSLTSSPSSSSARKPLPERCASSLLPLCFVYSFLMVKMVKFSNLLTIE